MLKIFNRGRDNSSSDVYAATPSSAPPVSGPARPIRLVYCDEKGKFQMDPEAVATLQLVKEPIGVVSVCGRARQGKSFILNQVNCCPTMLLYICFRDCNLRPYSFRVLGVGFVLLNTLICGLLLGF